MNTNVKPISRAVIISETANGVNISAASARISTTKGNALDIYENSQDQNKNLNLINKIIDSGHRSVLEHHVFNIAFNNVTAFIEQFLIEFRLSSFTIKSRRYVDFSNMGYFIPSNMTEEMKNEYCTNMNSLFTFYEEMLENGIPKEDARFILPYCYFSNFYCTCNTRELVHIICSMVYGRGKQYPEIVDIGNQLKIQLEERYPNIVSSQEDMYTLNYSFASNNNFDFSVFKEDMIEITQTEAELISATPNGELLLLDSLSLINDGNKINKSTSSIIKGLLNDSRPRNLELLNFTFKISNISLAGLTHLVRHRMQSIIIPNLITVPFNKKFIVPSSIKKNTLICEKYMTIMSENIKFINKMITNGMPISNIVYFALSGNQINVIANMNARELLLFIRLRSCNRAQWEIREVSDKMLLLLKEYSGEIFNNYGPSCVVNGICPEGKFSCGRVDNMPRKLRE